MSVAFIFMPDFLSADIRFAAVDFRYMPQAADAATFILLICSAATAMIMSLFSLKFRC